MKLAIVQLVQCRATKVGTACSGSDVAVITAVKLAGIMNDIFGGTAPDAIMKFEHCWSCELDASKQQFLVKNLGVAHLYGDISQLGSARAVNVAGGPEGSVEEEIAPIDLFICGFSCKDLSNLKSGAVGGGASGHTGSGKVDKAAMISSGIGTTGNTAQGVLGFMAEHAPAAVILENVTNLASEKNEAAQKDGAEPAAAAPMKNLQYLTAAFQDMNYSFHIMKLNPTQSGLPQNRPRVYIIGIKMDGSRSVDQINASISSAYKEIGSGDQAPIDDFLLPMDEYERWAQQRKCKKAKADGAAAAKWRVDHAKTYRANDIAWPPARAMLESSLGPCFLSASGAGSSAGSFAFTDREVEIVNLILIKYPLRPDDDEELIIDVSQSIDRVTPMKNKFPCMTPNQRVYLCRRRRMLTGEEALRLQGLWREHVPFMDEMTDRQLHDLAGNAFCSVSFAACLLSLLAAL